MITYKTESGGIAAFNPRHLIRLTTKRGKLVAELTDKKVAVLDGYTMREVLAMIKGENL